MNSNQHLITFYNAYLEQRQVKQTAMNTTIKTTGKEVLNITTTDCELLWRDDDGFIAQGTGNTYKTFADTNVNDDDIDDREKRTEMILRSFNETYGKGYRPEAMEELYKALAELTEMALRWSVKGVTPTIYTAQTALQNAKIQVLP